MRITMMMILPVMLLGCATGMDEKTKFAKMAETKKNMRECR